VIVRRFAKRNVYLFHGKGSFNETVRGEVIESVLIIWTVVVARKRLEVIE
jgi:hypothetical protein